MSPHLLIVQLCKPTRRNESKLFPASDIIMAQSLQWRNKLNPLTSCQCQSKFSLPSHPPFLPPLTLTPMTTEKPIDHCSYSYPLYQSLTLSFHIIILFLLSWTTTTDNFYCIFLRSAIWTERKKESPINKTVIYTLLLSLISPFSNRALSCDCDLESWGQWRNTISCTFPSLSSCVATSHQHTKRHRGLNSHNSPARPSPHFLHFSPAPQHVHCVHGPTVMSHHQETSVSNMFWILKRRPWSVFNRTKWIMSPGTRVLFSLLILINHKTALKHTRRNCWSHDWLLIWGSLSGVEEIKDDFEILHLASEFWGSFLPFLIVLTCRSV